MEQVCLFINFTGRVGGGGGWGLQTCDKKKSLLRDWDYKMQTKEVEQIKKILVAGIVIAIGLIIFKYLPMLIFGKDILFDA